MLGVRFRPVLGNGKLRSGPSPYFGYGKFGIRPFFGNPVKSGSVQISSRICRIWRIPLPVQLQYAQSIRPTDKTNASDLSSGVFAILTRLV